MSSESQSGPSPSFTPSLSDVEPGTARYLFAISLLSESGSDRVTTGELREYLSVAPASVTEMFSKLDGRGFVEYEKYRGATLTDRGQTLATEARWRFCVVATFFDSVLGATLDEETALEVSFALPEHGVFRLRDLIESECLNCCPEAEGGAERCVA